jgi:glycogen synthase
LSGLVGACFGDPHDPATLSGVPKHLFDALERRFGPVARIDYRLRPWQRILVAGRSVRLSRAAWQERYHLNTLSFGFRSRNLHRAVSRVAGPGDAVVQVFGVVQPSGRPYVVYADQTWLMVAEQWQRWLPSQVGEREEWVERERRMYRQARHVFTMAGPAAESLRTSYGVPAQNVTVVGGGVNFDTLPAVPGPERKEPVILFVGRDPLR